MKRTMILTMLCLAILSIDSARGAVELYHREINQKNPSGKDLVMTLRETRRDEITSTVKVTMASGASVPSSLFIMRGFYDIARIRDVAYFIKLNEKREDDGSWTYIVGFSNKKNVNAQKLFKLEKPLTEEEGFSFLAVKDFDLVFKESKEFVRTASPPQPTARPAVKPPEQDQPSTKVREANGLVGDWRAVSGKYQGQALPQSQMPNKPIIFSKDGHWSDTAGAEATWIVDETKSPKALELNYTAGRDRGQRQLCVYGLAGDRLTIAFGIPGGREEERPRTVNDSLVFTFERIQKANSGSQKLKSGH